MKQCNFDSQRLCCQNTPVVQFLAFISQVDHVSIISYLPMITLWLILNSEQLICTWTICTERQRTMKLRCYVWTWMHINKSTWPITYTEKKRNNLVITTPLTLVCLVLDPCQLLSIKNNRNGTDWDKQKCMVFHNKFNV